MRAAILLAAGASRRFGRQDKLRQRLAGRSLLAHAIANARASGARRILLVSARPISVRGVTNVRARDAKRGLSASLAAGLGALRPIDREVLIFLADMPFAQARSLRLTPGFDAIRPRFGGQPGHPMLVRSHAARLALGRGDKGLAGALRTAFVAGKPGHVLDIDTPAALRLLRLQGSRGLRLRSQAAAGPRR
jgi:molybdenum cofactor cytidylyltransferase